MNQYLNLKMGENKLTPTDEFESKKYLMNHNNFDLLSPKINLKNQLLNSQMDFKLSQNQSS